MLDVESEGSVPYQVLELLHGESLQDRLERSPMNWHECWTIAQPILSALQHAQHAHDAGIVHRDIKPDNIFLAKTDRGVVPKLVDFGIAKLLSSGEGLTRTGMLMGTPLYLSPEQARSSKDVGPAADLWSMGVVLYECLSGRYPFDFDWEAGLPWIIHQICEDDPVPLDVVGVPDQVAGAIMSCLEKSPENRVASARELSAQLASAGTKADFALEPTQLASPYGASGATARETPIETLLPESTPATPARLTAPPEQPMGARAAALGIALLLVAGGIAFAIAHDSSSATPIEPAAPPVAETPIETSPIETSPIETSPIETSPIETSPIETSLNRCIEPPRPREHRWPCRTSRP